MALTQVGTPTATAFITATGAATNSWSGTQPRNRGDVLVMVITAAATTSVTAPSAPAGWTQAVSVGNTATSNASVFIFWKIAAGGDTAPSTTVTLSGTARCGCTLYELTSGASTFGNPNNFIDQTGTFASGASSAFIGTITATTGGNLKYTGEFGIAAFARQQGTAATMTWTAGSGFTNSASDGATSTADHNAVDVTSSAPSSGSSLSDVATVTTAGASFASAGIATWFPGTPSYWLSSPVAAGFPSVADRCGNGARLPVRGRTAGYSAVRSRTAQNAPASHSSGQPAGVRVIYQRAGNVQTSQVTPPTAAPLPPAKFYPFTEPAAAVVRPLPIRGTCRTNISVAFSLAGPPLRPLSSPVQPRYTPPPRGRAQGRAGTLTPVAPQLATFRPDTTPNAAVTRPLPPRGRTWSNPGIFDQAGPQFRALNHPVQARRPLPAPGTAKGRAGTFTPVAPQSATVYPLGRPAAAVIRPAPIRGRIYTRAGIFGQAGPAVTPQHRALRAKLPLQPLLRGRVNRNAGTSGQAGPPVRQLQGPVRPAVRGFPLRGTTQSRVGVFTAVNQPAVVYPLRKPVTAAVRVFQPRGRVAGQAGVFGQVGPQVTPQQRALRARLPQQPLLRGRASSSPGVFGQHGPAIRPLSGPVAAVTRPLPSRGRAQGRAGVFTAVVQAGPSVYPLRGPVAAVVRPQPPRGRAQGHAGAFRGSGPAVKPLQHPVYAWRPGPRRGVCLTSIRPGPPAVAGSKFYPLRKPVRAPIPPLLRRAGGSAQETPPYVTPFVPQGGFGYPYDAKLMPARWYGFAVNGEWAGQSRPVRYSATSTSAGWSSTATAGRWFTASGPA